jgi:hypothetical protein
MTHPRSRGTPTTRPAKFLHQQSTTPTTRRSSAAETTWCRATFVRASARHDHFEEGRVGVSQHELPRDGGHARRNTVESLPWATATLWRSTAVALCSPLVHKDRGRRADKSALGRETKAPAAVHCAVAVLCLRSA